jgi:hypothetical protein
MAKQKIWEKKNPKKKHKKLSADQKQAAKRSAKKHGRSTPSLVDNINAKKKAGKKKSGTKQRKKSR